VNGLLSPFDFMLRKKIQMFQCKTTDSLQTGIQFHLQSVKFLTIVKITIM